MRHLAKPFFFLIWNTRAHQRDTNAPLECDCHPVADPLSLCCRVFVQSLTLVSVVTCLLLFHFICFLKKNYIPAKIIAAASFNLPWIYNRARVIQKKKVLILYYYSRARQGQHNKWYAWKEQYASRNRLGSCRTGPSALSHCSFAECVRAHICVCNTVCWCVDRA